MTWLVRVLLVAAVAAVWFVPPIPPEQATDTASISTYDAAMELSREGELVTVETIAVQMPGGKRGIFRIFDTADPRRVNVTHPGSSISPLAAISSPVPTCAIAACRSGCR